MKKGTKWRKMRLMRKPRWYVELMLALSACILLTAVPMWMICVHEKKKAGDDIASAVEVIFHDQTKSIMRTEGVADWYINAENRVMAGTSAAEDLYFQSDILGGWNVYEDFCTPIRSAYRIIGVNEGETTGFDKEAKKDYAVLTLRDPDTYREYYYICSKQRVVEALTNALDQNGALSNKQCKNGLNTEELVMDEIYIGENSFMLDGQTRYAGIGVWDKNIMEADGEYTRCDVTDETGQGMTGQKYVHLDGHDYAISALDVYNRDISEKLSDEQQALDTLADSIYHESWKDRIDMPLWYNMDNTYTWLNSYDDGDRAGNDRCGKLGEEYREYAGMLGRLTAPDGQRYWLIGTISYDIISVQKIITEIVIRTWLTFCMLLSVLLTIIIYLTRKNNYDRQEYRRNMTNAMAHDLKTPLMAMSGYAENLLENVHTDKRQKYAEAISVNVRRMNGMIEQMLEIDRLESGKRRNIEIPESVDMAELFRKVIAENEVLIQRRNMKVTIDGDCILKANKESMPCDGTKVKCL